MNLKLYKIVSTFFALILINTFAFAQNNLISGSGHQSIPPINSSIAETNPIRIKVKANAELPATLIEKYLNQDKAVYVESEGAILFSGQIHKYSSGISNLTIVNKNSGTISFLDNSKIHATNGTLNLNIETDATIAVANLALLETNGGNIRLRALKDSESIANNSINSILIKGKLNASSTYKGGKIVLESDHIKLEDQSIILAQGEQGGGTILIGGDWQGLGTIRQATTVTMNQGAIIDASAIQNGNGGKVVLWSDVNNPNSLTKAQGSIFAKAGSQAGNGGKVETSGYMLNVDGISVSTQASKGLNGEWLLDPRDIIINSSSDSGVSNYTANVDNAVINVTTLTNALATTNVTVFTGSTGTSQAGNITVSSAINAGGTGTLTLWAANTITINADITRSSTGGLTLRAGSGSVTGSGVLNLSAGTTLEISHGSTISNNIVVGTGGATFKLSQQLDAQVLIVAGGGAGGGRGWAGGGGGGGVIYGNTAISSGTTTITVGAGGSGQASSNGLGNNGGNSQFGSVTALGGGGGSGYGWGDNSIAANGAAGGSGGGVGEDNFTSQMQGGAATTQSVPSGWTAYGNVGGSGSYTSGVQAGGGGGGAGSPGVGTTAYRTPGGGGSGITFNISGSNQTYGGGGGGATCSTCGTQGSGGSGGGGAGGDGVGVNGTNGLGGGAGGSHSAANATGGSGVVVVRYAGTTAMATGGTITTSGNSTIHTFSSVGTNNFIVNGSFSASLTGAISGSGPLTVNASGGTLTFSGTNTNTGSTTISGGTMILANATGTGIHDSSAATISAGAILDLRYSETIGSLAGAGTVTTGTSGAKTLTVGNDNLSTTFSGVIQNGSGSLVLTKVGSGTLTLTGNNTYTGLTTVSAGTLKFAPSSTFDMNMPGGIVNNSDFIFDGTNGGGLGGMFFITGASGSGTWNITGTTSGRGQYQNRLILNGSTTISGQVTVTNYGNLWLENTNINSTSPIFLNGANTYLNLYALSSTVMKIGALSGNGKVDAAGNGNTTILTLSLGNDNGTATFSGTLLNSGTTSLSLTKEGTGIQTLSGLSDYRGVTNINGGTLKVSSTGKIYQTDITVNLNVNSGAVLDVYNWAWGGSLGNLRFDPGNLVINGGTILYSGITGGDWRSFTVGSLGATFENPTDGVTWNLNNSAQAPVISGNLTFSGAGNFTLGHTITGSGYSLIKNGSGTLIMTGNNTYTGVTTINAGTLTFRNDAPNLTSSSFVGPGALVVEPNGTSFTSSYTFNETLSSVTKLGSLTLGKAGNTANITNSNALDINGPITIHAGNLTLTGGLTTSNSSTGNIGLTVATVTGANIALATGRALTITQSGNGTYAGVISGTDATFTKAGAGALYLTGVSTFTGGTTISAGFLELNTTGRISGNIVNNGQLSFNQDASLTYSDIISGTGTVIKYGTTTLTLTGANTYSGGTTVSGGTLRAGISSTGTVTNGPFGTGLVTVGSGFTLEMNGFTVANALSLSGVGISSNGALINTGGAASTTGAVTITSPTAIGGSGAITMTGAISASTHLVSILNAVGVTAENTSNSIATVAITNSALILKTTTSLTVNASSLTATTRLQTVSASRDITVSGAITNNTNANTLTLMASRDILIAAAISGATGKSLTTNFYSDVDNSGGGGFKSTVSTATISTFGGDITIGGGTADSTSGCGTSYSCTSGYASYGNSQADAIGVLLWSSLNAAGGNITIYGRGNSTASTSGVGIWIDFTGTALNTSGTGTITLNGYSTGANYGIYHYKGDLTAGTGLISINATAGSTSSYSGYKMVSGSISSNGALSIAGTGGSNEYGVYIYGAGAISVAGDITINGQNATRNWGVSIESNKLVQSTAGNISVTAVGSSGFYLDGDLIAGNHLTTPTAGGNLTINATSTSGYGFQSNTGSLISFGAASITASSNSQHAVRLEGSGSKILSASDITINGTQGSWGLTMYDNSFIQSTGGNILITATGTSGGLYSSTTGGIYASSNTANPTVTTPTAGGSLTILATGGTQYGIQMTTSSLISFGNMSLTASSSLESIYIYGTGSVRSVGNLTLNAATSGASQWAIYLNNSRTLQSIAGNININSTSALGHGVYINGGGLVAGNESTTPTSGGGITINSSSSANDIAGAALRLDGSSTKIIAYSDISIYANGAALGLNGVNQQGHGIILWGGAQVIRSFAGSLSMTGYATRSVGADCTNWACISGGITLYSGGITLQAYNNLTMNGVSGQGIGLYLTFANSTGGGIFADRGNIVINGLSNNASYGGSVIRLPITATEGSVTISVAGQNYAYYQDAWSGSISAKTDVNIIGYATSGHGIYLGTGSVTSSNGNVILSGYTSSTNTGHYGIYSNAINVLASNGSVTFQGSKLDTVSTLANAVSNLSGATPTPLFAIADSASMSSAATNGVYWTGNITANTTSGQINIYGKAPYVSGVMTAFGLLLGTPNQSYTLSNSNAVIKVLAASIGSGSLNFKTASNLEIGSLSGVDGFTGSGLTITSTATLSQTKPISVSTLTLAGTNGIFDLSLANTLSTSVALNSGTLKVGHSSALGTTSAPLTMAANSILLSNLSTLALSNPITLSGASTINAPSTHTLTLSGIISSSGNLTINSPTTNTGTVVFTGANTYTGTTTLSAGTLQIGSGSTTGALGTGAVTNNGALIFNRSNDFTVANTISGSGSMTKEGSGALTLTSNSTYSGGTTVNAGTLVLSDSYATPGNGVIIGTLTVNSNGIVQLKNNPGAFGWNTNRVSTININGGLLEAVTTNQHIWNATLNFSGGGTLRSNGGTSSSSSTSYWEWGGVTVNVTNPTAEAVIAGRLNLRSDLGTSVFTVADGVATNDLMLSAAMTNASAAYPMGFTKAGAGTMTVSGANTNTGAITVNAGTLAVTDGAGLGTTAGGVTVASGSTLDLQNVTVGAENITLNGGTLAASTGTSSLAGTVALGAASTVNVAGNQLTLSGIVSGANALQKLGLGHLILTATNTYSGVTTIDGGNLTFRNDVPNLTSSSFVGPGNLIVEPSGANFTSAYTFNETLSSATKLGGLTIGKAGSTQNITTSTAINVEGSITLTGGTVAINAAVTTANNSLNITATTAASQTASIVAKDVVLQGAGTFTLTNTSNNIESITGGDVTRLGNLSLTDASDGLTINNIISGTSGTNGAILIETLQGDLTLAQNINTSSTSVNAINLNAGKSSAIGTITGGNIIVSGTPTITTGTGGIAKLYSGSEASSTGLTALVGGLANTRFSADEGTTTFSPVLAAGNSYAIYRSTVPASPINLVATAGNAQISVAFTAAADGGGSITNYEYTIDGGTTWIAASPSVTSSPLVISGLTNYTTYAVRIRAVNNAGSGTASASVSAMPFAPSAAPTDIVSSATSINENVSANTTIGTLSSTDINVGDTFTYTLVSGSGDTDNASFNISSNSLRITASPDFETKSSYTVRIKTTDQGGLSFEKAFAVTVTNVIEIPLFSMSQNNITGVVAMPFSTIEVSQINGTVRTFSISPALPLGLALNTTTGSISGTPIQASASKIYTISGSNSDGIGTASLTLFIDGDLDGDGIGDTTDLDTDNDGISDAIEKGSNGATPIDTDNDGTPDYRDLDSDNDGISDAIEKGPNGANPIDSDGDGIPDYRDMSSAITDLDIDGDGVTATQEALDGTDSNNSCSSIPSSITMPLKPSFLEGDCDFDGLTNGQELGINPTQPTDIDNNGTLDYLEFNNHSDSEDDLEVFNSITNNGDNLNDAFIIRGIENYPNNTLYIYNRWGVEVYSVEGYAQDDKYFRGISEGRRTISQSAEIPKGTYYYILRYVNKQGVEKQRTGYLYITK